MAKTKKAIIEALKAADTATIAFKGLVGPDAVRAARDAIIKDWNAQAKVYNKKHPDADIAVVVGDTMISAGTQTQFLPAFPKTGALVVKSKEYVIADVHCAFVDILPLTFDESALNWGFQTKAGNTVIIPK